MVDVSFVEFLKTSRLGSRDRLASILNFFLGIIFVGMAYVFFDKEQFYFRCNFDGKDTSNKTKDFLKNRCYLSYNELFNRPLSLHIYINLIFFFPTVLCTVYSFCCVKACVDRVEEAYKFDKEKPARRRDIISTKRIYSVYILQMVLRLLFRVANMVLFVCIPQIPRNYPSEFDCQLPTKNVLCINSVASEKTVLAYAVFFLNLLFVLYLACELWFLILKGCLQPTFLRDSQFCEQYLSTRSQVPQFLKGKSNTLKLQILEQTQYVPLLPRGLDHNKNFLYMDKVYTSINLYSTKNGKRSKVEYENLFYDNKRTILILGNNGIGKSLFCTKLLRDWSNGNLRSFKHAFLFRFQYLNSNSMQELSLKDFLSRSEHSVGDLNDDEFQFVLDNPAKILIVFDGLDEFKYRHKCKQDENNFAGFNGANHKIPVSAIFIKLLEKKLLRGARTITTTRPSAIDSVASHIQFDSVLELVGFEDHEEVKYYVKECFKTQTIEEEKSEKEREEEAETMWEHIQSNMMLLELCKTPALCFIVCNLFLQKLSFDSCSSLTQVYQEIIRKFILTHHPAYKSKLIETVIQTRFKDLKSEVKIGRLTSLAYELLENNYQTEFGQKELDKHGLQSCNLIICQPRDDNLPYGYNALPRYKFALPYLQEFLAAIYKVDKVKCRMAIHTFIDCKLQDENWHLVLQFIVGLMDDCSSIAEKLKSLLKSTLVGSVQNSSTKARALCLVKCFHELKVEMKSLSEVANIRQIDFSFPPCISPVDLDSITDFVGHLQFPLDVLNLKSNDKIKDIGISKLSTLIESNVNQAPIELNISGCNVGDEGLKDLMAAVRKDNCSLAYLILSENSAITQRGIDHVCLALKDDKCNIKKLDLYGIKLSERSATDICTALGDRNCKLSELCANFDFEFKLFDKGIRAVERSDAVNPWPRDVPAFEMQPVADDNVVCMAKKRPLFEALTSQNRTSLFECLRLDGNGITNDGLTLLCEIIKHPNCRLKNIYLRNNLITDVGLLMLIRSLRMENGSRCVEEIHLESNCITYGDESRERLQEALRCADLKLSKLYLSNNKISETNKRDLRMIKPKEGLHILL